MVDKKKHKWVPKGDGWSILEITDLNELSLDQSLKVQEMFDNKIHQRFQREQLKKQDRFNTIILTTTIILALVGISQVFNLEFNPSLLTKVLVGLAFIFFTMKLGYDLIKTK